MGWIRRWMGAALAWAALVTAAAASPAETPPDGFRAGQYIDSRGCVFTRADGGVWQARLARDGSPICGYPPTSTALRVGADRLPPLAAADPSDRMAQDLAVAVMSGLQKGELLPSGPEGGERHSEPARMNGKDRPDAPPLAAGGEGGQAEIRVTSRARPAAVSPASTEADGPAARLATLFDKAPEYRAATTRRATGTDRLCALLGGGEAAARGGNSAGTLGYCELTPLPFAARKLAIAASPAAGPEPAPFAEGRSPQAPGARDAGVRPTTGAGTARVAAPGRTARRDNGGARSSRAHGQQAGLPAAPGAATTRVILPGHRFVQVGTYRDPGNAARAAEHSASLGLPVRRTTLRRGQTTHHVVLAGPFAGREGIVRALAALRRAGYRDAFSR